VPSPGATRAERARAEHTAAVELAGLGFGDGSALDGQLAATLRVLAAPASECYGWIVPAYGTTFGVLAARSAAMGALGALTGDVVELWPLGHHEPAAAVVERLPNHPPAPRAVTTEHNRAAFEVATLDSVVG